MEYNDEDFVESSIKINLPGCIAECFEMYSNDLVEFNVIEDFEYKGEELDWRDDGYSENADIELFLIVSIKDGESSVLYSDYNGDIEWASSIQEVKEQEELN